MCLARAPPKTNMGQHASSLRAGLQDDYDAALAGRPGVSEVGSGGAEAARAGPPPPPVPGVPHAALPAPRPPGLSLSEVAALRSPSARRAWDVGALTLPLMMVLDRYGGGGRGERERDRGRQQEAFFVTPPPLNLPPPPPRPLLSLPFHSDRDGTVSLEELAAFAAAAATVAAAAAAATGAPFAEAVRGAATLAASAELGSGAGDEDGCGGGAATAAVAAWLVRLAVADDAAAGVVPPRAGLVSRAAVAAVVGLFVPPADAEEEGEGDGAAAAHRPDPPGFARLFDALQAAAEDGGDLDPLDPALDGWLPAAALARVAEGAVAGAAGLWGRVVGRDGCGGGQLPPTAVPLPPLVRALGIRE